jgi:hypothetical protein
MHYPKRQRGRQLEKHQNIKSKHHKQPCSELSTDSFPAWTAMLPIRDRRLGQRAVSKFFETRTPNYPLSPGSTLSLASMAGHSYLHQSSINTKLHLTSNRTTQIQVSLQRKYATALAQISVSESGLPKVNEFEKSMLVYQRKHHLWD